MVLGKGLLSSVFKHLENDDLIFLTSGVSDSYCDDNTQFDREVKLVNSFLKENPKKIFIYFSTTSIFQKKTPYTKHKKNIEILIKKSKVKYYIFRVPQLIGNGGNKNNLFNFLVENMKKNNKIPIHNVKRSFIDVSDLFEIVKYVLYNDKNGGVYNFFGIEFMYVNEIVELIKSHLDIVIYNFQHKTDTNELFVEKNSKKINEAIDFLKIQKNNYTKNTIKKYIK